MKKLRVLVLTHEDLVPPDSIEGLDAKQIQPWKREFHVTSALRDLGHEVQVLGVSDDLAPIRATVEGWEPHVVFNLLLEFHDVGAYLVHVASYLELLKVPYTGSPPRGLLLARDKVLSKKVFRYHRIPTPAFATVRKGQRVRAPRRLRFPLIVKSADEDAGLGLAQASIVHDFEQLAERVGFIHRNVGTDALVEAYIEGRELTIGLLGNERVRAFPVWEMQFKNLPEGAAPIATARVKWDLEYQKKIGIDTGAAKGLPEGAAERIARLARRIHRILGLGGFSRIDLRLADDARIYVIEANATPDLSKDEDFAESAEKTGIRYPELIQRILNLAIRRRAAWRGDG